MKQTPPLEVRDIRKSFGSLEVLKGISLTAHQGDIISILGSSGSGKSTFLRCINFLEHPTEGKIFVDEREVVLRRNREGQLEPRDAKELTELRARLAMVFQSFNLWRHLTVLENVTIAQIHVKGTKATDADTRSKHFLERVGMSARLDFYPSQLSGGQKQRVAIARALAMEPEILLFDEPTSALDPEMVGDVLKVMRDLAEEGRTMLVVTHEMAFARDVSTRVMFMNQGLVDAIACPQEMFRNPADKSARWAEFIARM
ncbi:ATP-binding cassette domain-containing protein (plasmid) [Ensifer adhaerens]|uniref:ABC transporter ATP-binding protein n=1 Tax=Ensifer adhaerens TaxID=106592 RepID=UPI0023A9D501|nr:ATP-binding cassette domain-containing protein [Ensifer adhaerens]WDZ81936.1 ATP-binding cassette domain-containing protein [Ensifer adhaerens]